MKSNWEEGMDKGEELSLAYKILSHLNRHPGQCDTIRGIAEWWILQQKIDTQISRVKKALSTLVRMELVLAIPGSNNMEKPKSNNVILYRINPSKGREIEAFLRQGNHPVPMD
jgi:hypothetical protein